MTADEYNKTFLNGYSWEMHPTDSMILLVKHHNEIVLRIFIGEAMEQAGRTAVLAHVQTCEGSEWIDSWHERDTKAMLKALVKEYTNV